MLGEAVTLKLTPSVADGYELYVNGENVTQDGGCTITLTGEQTSVSIALHAGDEITEYTLILCASDGCTVRIPVDSADIALQVFDQNGQAVTGSFNEKALIYVFSLVPGQTYTYTATKDTYYHAEGSFTAAFMTLTKVSVPTDTWLSDLSLSKDGATSSKGSIALDQTFQPSVHAYTAVVPDTPPAVYLWSDGDIDTAAAAMKTKAKDFKIFWDNAYCIHHLSDTPDTLLNILDECEKAGNPDRVYMLASTSKVTFPGAGVAMIASSEKNIKYLKSMMTVQTIGYDKINQLRHVKFFGTYENLMEHMKKHRAIIEPKFKIVLDTLEKEIAPLGIGSWEKPNGGYFISFNALNGCAKRICQLCKEAGVVLTGAGATYPYGKDPDDSNIRIAPTFPPENELKIAADVFATAVKLASAEKLLAE